MKLKTILAVAVVALSSAACSDDEKQPAVADIAGSYEGYTLAGCAYFQNTCTAGETVVVTENTDGTARVEPFTLDSWGEFTIPGAQMMRTAAPTPSRAASDKKWYGRQRLLLRFT